jgi:hypothetical protein
MANPATYIFLWGGDVTHHATFTEPIRGVCVNNNNAKTVACGMLSLFFFAGGAFYAEQAPTFIGASKLTPSLYHNTGALKILIMPNPATRPFKAKANKCLSSVSKIRGT